MTDLTCTGLDGAHPLGFLCALGALRTLTLAWPQTDVCLAWQHSRAVWQPVLRVASVIDGDVMTADRLVLTLAGALSALPVDVLMPWDGTHDIAVSDYRAYSQRAARHFLDGHDRTWADFAAVWASDGAIQAAAKPPTVMDTAFRTMSGQGHQHFLKQMRELVSSVGPIHVREALFGPWRYADDGLNLRWDPADDRRHAQRWKDPSKDQIKTVWGANRLAVEALPLFPVFPNGRRLSTTGFQGRRADDMVLTWPMWTGFATLDVVRSLLALEVLQSPEPDREHLARRGIPEVFRARRLKVDRFRAFTYGQPV